MRTLMVGLVLLLLTGSAAVQAQNDDACPRPAVRRQARKLAPGHHRRRLRPWQSGANQPRRERPRRNDLPHISYFTAPAHDIGVPPTKAKVPGAGTITVDGQVFEVPQAVP